MKAGYTFLVAVVDRSASMSSMAREMQDGLNRLVSEQAALPGECNVTLVQFDDVVETVASCVPAGRVTPYRLVPRGNTALLDAVGSTIAKVGDVLAAIPEADRPEKVVFLVATDGYENASREYQRAQVQEMIRVQTEQYKWEFVYLGANVDAFAEAAALGMTTANSMDYSPDNLGVVMRMASSKVGEYRAGLAASLAWTGDERDAAEKAGKTSTGGTV